MTRLNVYMEGLSMPGHAKMAVGALRFPEGEILVTEPDGNVVGTAKDFQRVTDGEFGVISADVDVELPNGLSDFGLYCDSLQRNEDNWYTSARVRSVTVASPAFTPNQERSIRRLTKGMKVPGWKPWWKRVLAWKR